MSDPGDYEAPEEKRARRRAEKAQRARQGEADAVLQSIMGGTAGRAWMWDLLSQCGVFQTSANVNPYYTYLNEGKRNIGLMLLAQLMRATPAAYIRMTQESSDGRRDPEPVLDRTDHDDDRNYDSAGRWIGEGNGPDPDDPAGWGAPG